jgi:hypothetical protein
VQRHRFLPLDLVPDEDAVGDRPDDRLAAQVVPALDADAGADPERLRGLQEVRLRGAETHVRGEEHNVRLVAPEVLLDLGVWRHRPLSQADEGQHEPPERPRPPEPQPRERRRAPWGPPRRPSPVGLPKARVEELEQIASRSQLAGQRQPGVAGGRRHVLHVDPGRFAGDLGKQTVAPRRCPRLVDGDRDDMPALGQCANHGLEGRE